MQTEKILGINVSVADYYEFKEDIRAKIQNNEKITIASANPEIMLQSRKDEKLQQIINSATYAIPDGIGVVYASKILGGNIKERVTGIDLMYELCDLAVQSGLSVFLYGAKPGVAKKVAVKLQQQYPGITIAGYIDGYEQDKNKIINAINESKAKMVFVALGAPRQEYWIYENADKVCGLIFEGVGGSFDVISGNIKRAPMWIQNHGFEWLYRLIIEPTRFFRQLRLVKFIFTILFSSRH